MSQIKSIAGQGIPLIGDDIDTDRIIPARFLKCVTFDGLGPHAFEDDRAQASGQHSFDQPHYQNATILVVNRNFGCGSSREHAPQAIAKWGIQALIGESFAEIFLGNCVAIGVPCVTTDRTTLKRLQELLIENPQALLTVNLEMMQVYSGDVAAAIAMSDGSKHMFLSGNWDTCGQLVSQTQQVQKTATQLPYTNWSRLATS